LEGYSGYTGQHGATRTVHNLEQLRLIIQTVALSDSGRRELALSFERRTNHMKKPTLRIEQQQPRNIQRADIAPDTGYAMVVDGRFKTHYPEESAAKKGATELLARYPMQVEIYDAEAKSRSKVQARNTR
jgi:hypothetical protein